MAEDTLTDTLRRYSADMSQPFTPEQLRLVVQVACAVAVEVAYQYNDICLYRRDHPNEGIGMFYGNQYMDVSDPNGFKVDVILFVVDGECMNSPYEYAEIRFHGMNDDYRRYTATVDSEKIRRQHDSIVSDGDVVSKHNFRLPETIQAPHESGGKEYGNQTISL